MENLQILLTLIVIFSVLLLIFRKAVLWYWKVNKAIDLLEKIEKNTRKDNHTG